MKRYPMSATAPAAIKKLGFALIASALIMLAAAPGWAQADVCATAFQAVPSCGVTITITGTSGNLVTTIGGSRTPYDGIEDQLVGITNNSSVKVGAIVLSGPSSAPFAFDFDGPCAHFGVSGCGTPTGYEGPRNSFVGINSDGTTGKVLFKSPLAAGESTWFALEGIPASVVAVGENQTLVAGTTSIYRFGPFKPVSESSSTFSENGSQDDFKVTPLNSASGDALTVTAVPVPAWQPGTATNFPNLQCLPYFDYSSGTTQSGAVCVELELDCSSLSEGGDSCNFQYNTQLDYGIFGPGVPSGNLIGGPHFLVQHDVACPTNGFTDDIFVSYTGANAGPPTQADPPPLKGGGKGTHSCYVSAFDPTAQLIQPGVTVSAFDGFEFPLSDTRINPIFRGFPEPLIWDFRDSSGNPVTNLHLCTDPTFSTCTTKPWVFPSLIALSSAVACQQVAASSSPLPSFLNSGLLNGDDPGEYVFLWDTRTNVKKVRGCQVSVQLQFDSGLVQAPAKFQYVF